MPSLDLSNHKRLTHLGSRTIGLKVPSESLKPLHVRKIYSKKDPQRHINRLNLALSVVRSKTLSDLSFQISMPICFIYEYISAHPLRQILTDHSNLVKLFFFR